VPERRPCTPRRWRDARPSVEERARLVGLVGRPDPACLQAAAQPGGRASTTSSQTRVDVSCVNVDLGDARGSRSLEEAAGDLAVEGGDRASIARGRKKRSLIARRGARSAASCEKQVVVIGHGRPWSARAEQQPRTAAQSIVVSKRHRDEDGSYGASVRDDVDGIVEQPKSSTRAGTAEPAEMRRSTRQRTGRPVVEGAPHGALRSRNGEYASINR